MRKVFSILQVFTVWAVAFTAAGAAPPPQRLTVFDAERTVRADGGRGPYRISDRPILVDSERVWVGDSLLVRDLDYDLDYAGGLLLLARERPRGVEVLVRFRQLPRVLSRVYRRRERNVRHAPVRPAPVPRRRRRAAAKAPEAYGEAQSRLDVGGAKRIQVTVGGNRDLELSQALRVHITGQMADGVEVTALLSDRNLPLGFQGSTRSLQELDRVMFQVRSRKVSASLGDLDVAFGGTAFGRYRRRLHGAHVAYASSGRDLRIFGAAADGRWISHRLLPVEGYQGPYRLPADAGVLGGRIVAGSERVWQDGRLLRRGESQDYVVDYEMSTITFTPVRPVTGQSRITVEYQYEAPGSRRRLMGARGTLALSSDRLKLGGTFIREADRDRAVPGVGISSPPFQPYRHQLAVMDAAYEPVAGVRLDGELALSQAPAQVDADRQRRGRAFRLGLDLWPDALRLGGYGIGRFRLTGAFRQIGARFRGIERPVRVAREGRWGWRADGPQAGDRMGEVALQYALRPGIRVDAGYGRRRGNVNAVRRDVGLQISDARGPQVFYRFDEVSHGSGMLARHRGRIRAPVRGITPGFRFESETATGSSVTHSTLFYASAPDSAHRGIRIREGAMDLSTRVMDAVSWTSEISIRRIHLMERAWQDSLRAWTTTHRASTSGWRGLSFSGEYRRSRTNSPVHPETGRYTDLARIRWGYDVLNGAVSHRLSYRISSTGAPVSEPVFIDVGRGRGTHAWEDVDGDGSRDPEEFVTDTDGEYVRFFNPSAGFRPVRDAALAARTEFVLKRLLKSPAGRWLRLLSGLSLDVSLEADRQAPPGNAGVAPWRLYGFGDGEGMLNGRRELRTRLYMFRYGRPATLRLSVRRGSRVDRDFTGGALETNSQASALGRLALGRTSSLEVTLHGETRDRPGEGPFFYRIRSRRISMNGYRHPPRSWQTRMELSVGRDREENRALVARYVSVRPEIRRALPGRGRLRVSCDWTRVFGSGSMPLFLRMADGNRDGNNVGWRLGVDYRLGRYMTAMVLYDGRKRPGRTLLHLGRMEMRALF
ncbi:MAG: hypothetical protein OXU79_18380 [Gemmatimonadota bacterium]|nr:hypothetical protein [Gemmatimonadota bacterium]